MKRSESILVYGVTGVLAVILAVAIAFGGEPADDGGDRVARVPPGVEGPVVDDIFDDILGPDDAGVDPVDIDPGPEPVEPPPNPIERPLNRVADKLGPFRTDEDAVGEKYRYVRVRPGDSIGLLIQRWCPGTGIAEIAALNETLTLDPLPLGVEVALPWYPDEHLLEAYDARRASSAAPVANADASVSGVPVAAEYVVRKGDSLWSIAAKRVGAANANAYVDEILRANPAIEDASRIREKQRIRLP